MAYTRLMVHLDMGIANGSLLKTTGYLAERFHAGVVGVSACKAMPLAYGDVYVSGGLIDGDNEEMALETAAAESEFRAALMPVTKELSWLARPGAVSISEFVAAQARRADLIITACGTKALLDPSRRLNIGELLMAAGRPVLLVPASAQITRLEHVIIGWKDNTSSRRAVADALPFLELATHVTVIEIAGGSRASGVSDVVEWLSTHGVAATARILEPKGAAAQQLATMAWEEKADLLVCGAYGHSRLGEWMWGGVTQDLLLEPPLPCLLSH